MLRLVRKGRSVLIDVEHRRNVRPSFELVVANEDQAKRSRFPDRSSAVVAFHNLVSDLVHQGYRIARDGAPLSLTGHAVANNPVTTAPELEARIVADEATDCDWSVLADLWTQAGDPRGEWIHLDPLRRTLPPQRVKRFMRSAIRSRNLVLFGPLGADAYRVGVEFKRGLADRVELNYEEAAPGRPTHELVALVLANPFTRFIRELVVRTVMATDTVLSAVAASAAKTLRRLTLESSTDVTALGAATHGFHGLLELEIRAPRIDWRDIDLPHLRTLTLHATFTADELADVFAWIGEHKCLQEIVGGSRSAHAAARTSSVVSRWGSRHKGWPRSLRRFAWDGHVAGRAPVDFGASIKRIGSNINGAHDGTATARARLLPVRGEPAHAQEARETHQSAPPTNRRNRSTLTTRR